MSRCSGQISNEMLATAPRHRRVFSRYDTAAMLRILVCEADDLMRGLIEEWLTSVGYCVRAVVPCNPAPEVAADLVIVDIEMPKYAGAQAADKIRAAHPRTPIIAISAQFRADLSTAGTTAQYLGVARVIAKPLTRNALLAAVSGIINPAKR